MWSILLKTAIHPERKFAEAAVNDVEEDAIVIKHP